MDVALQRVGKTGGRSSSESDVLAAYNYLGESTTVQIQYPLANVMLDLRAGPAACTMASTACFGRIIESIEEDAPLRAGHFL